MSLRTSCSVPLRLTNIPLCASQLAPRGLLVRFLQQNSVPIVSTIETHIYMRGTTLFHAFACPQRYGPSALYLFCTITVSYRPDLRGKQLSVGNSEASSNCTSNCLAPAGSSLNVICNSTIPLHSLWILLQPYHRTPGNVNP